jgi:hypothetical protein
MKYGGRCAYSGTILEDDWQVDHLEPILRDCGIKNHRANRIENLMPTQKLINHYKNTLPLESFRTWYLGGLHKRLKKLPKNPRTEKGKRHKAYMLKIANYFGITEDKPFSGKFYFETLND